MFRPQNYFSKPGQPQRQPQHFFRAPAPVSLRSSLTGANVCPTVARQWFGWLLSSTITGRNKAAVGGRDCSVGSENARPEPPLTLFVPSLELSSTMACPRTFGSTPTSSVFFGLWAVTTLKLATSGRITGEDLGFATGDVFTSLSNINGPAIVRRGIELEAARDPDFNRACDDVAAILLLSNAHLKKRSRTPTGANHHSPCPRREPSEGRPARDRRDDVRGLAPQGSGQAPRRTFKLRTSARTMPNIAVRHAAIERKLYLIVGCAVTTNQTGGRCDFIAKSLQGELS